VTIPTTLGTLANSINYEWLKNYIVPETGNEMPLARFTGRTIRTGPQMNNLHMQKGTAFSVMYQHDMISLTGSTQWPAWDRIIMPTPKTITGQQVPATFLLLLQASTDHTARSSVDP